MRVSFGKMSDLRELLTTERRIMLHLHRFRNIRDLHMVPAAVTQQGIAEGIRASRNFVSVVLEKLVASQVVEERTTHIAGAARQMRAYYLTVRGQQSAQEVLTAAADCIVKVRTAEGVKESKIARLADVLKPVPDLLDFVSKLTPDGVYEPEVGERLVAAETSDLGTRKVCLLGDAGVGKTSLIRRFVYSMFDDKYVSTIGTKVSSKLLQVGDESDLKRVRLVVWDLMGQIQFKRVRETALLGAQGALVVADITRPESLVAVEEWISALNDVAGDVPAVLIVNKVDLAESAKVTLQMAKEIAARHNMPYYFTSAKTGMNVDEAFRVLASLIVLGEDVKEATRLVPSDSKLVVAIDEIIDAYCTSHGGQEMNMEKVREAVNSAKLNIESPTPQAVERFIDGLVVGPRQGRSIENVEEERGRYLAILHRVTAAKTA